MNDRKVLKEGLKHTKGQAKSLLTLIGTTVSTGPNCKLAARGSKVTTKSTVSLSGAPGRFRTRSSSTLKPNVCMLPRSILKDTGHQPVLVARTT